jgi:dCMP deaminase
MEEEDLIYEEKIKLMDEAFKVSENSFDPVNKVGAIIVNKNGKIIATGYNHMPLKKEDCFPYDKNNKPLENKSSYIIHAEMDAILKAYKSGLGKDLSESTMYVTLSPCHKCAALIAESDIKLVYYCFTNFIQSLAISKKIFNETGVTSLFCPCTNYSKKEFEYLNHQINMMYENGKGK